jgi:hypothetical protein
MGCRLLTYNTSAPACLNTHPLNFVVSCIVLKAPLRIDVSGNVNPTHKRYDWTHWSHWSLQPTLEQRSVPLFFFVGNFAPKRLFFLHDLNGLKRPGLNVRKSWFFCRTEGWDTYWRGCAECLMFTGHGRQWDRSRRCLTTDGNVTLLAVLFLLNWSKYLRRC